jgi:hypothetical protein
MYRLFRWLQKLNPWHGIWYDPEHDMWFEGNMEEEIQKAKDAGLL